MKIVIVNAFETYDQRVESVCSFFKKKGAEVKVYTTNFNHVQKKIKTEKKESFFYIDVPLYRKNLSLHRLYSHYIFSKKVLQEVSKTNADLIYVLVPPNSLVKKFAKYKEKNPKVNLLFDIIDLWPETMPINKFKNIYPFLSWKNLRDKWLKYSDYVITECDLYRKYLPNNIRDLKTIYLCKYSNNKTIVNVTKKDFYTLCYLGSINNIIDIKKIAFIISEIKSIKPVILKIVGDGEKKRELIYECELAGAKIEDFGKIYNWKEKQDIFNSCDYGLNIYKENTCIGLTMKSVDYFQGGLPIINNIPGDTMKFIDRFNVGINIKTNEDIKQIAKKEINRSDVLDVFEKNFSFEIFEKNLESCINKMT